MRQRFRTEDCRGHRGEHDTKEKIEAAFADVPYPGDDDIAHHKDCLECDDIRAFFQGKSWRELKLPELYGWHSALTLFTPQALQYFLPGFMLASLERWEEADLIPEWILYQWLPREDDETEAKQLRRIERQSIFSLTQRKAVASFLQEYQTHEGSDSYLNRYFPTVISELENDRYRS